MELYAKERGRQSEGFWLNARKVPNRCGKVP